MEDGKKQPTSDLLRLRCATLYIYVWILCRVNNFWIICNCREKIDSKNVHPSLKSLTCEEALLCACDMDELVMVQNSSEDGSLFKSPSASAATYMSTGNPAYLKYLESVIPDFPCGGLLCVLCSLKLFSIHTFYWQQLSDKEGQIVYLLRHRK